MRPLFREPKQVINSHPGCKSLLAADRPTKICPNNCTLTANFSRLNNRHLPMALEDLRKLDISIVLII